MTDCPRQTGTDVRRAKRDLENLPVVVGVDVLDPNAGPRDEWTLEATVAGDRLPAEAVVMLADHDCAIVSTTLRAPDVTQVVVAV